MNRLFLFCVLLTQISCGSESELSGDFSANQADTLKLFEALKEEHYADQIAATGTIRTPAILTQNDEALRLDVTIAQTHKPEHPDEGTNRLIVRLTRKGSRFSQLSFRAEKHLISVADMNGNGEWHEVENRTKIPPRSRTGTVKEAVYQVLLPQPDTDNPVPYLFRVTDRSAPEKTIMYAVVPTLNRVGKVYTDLSLDLVQREGKPWVFVYQGQQPNTFAFASLWSDHTKLLALTQDFNEENSRGMLSFRPKDISKLKLANVASIGLSRLSASNPKDATNSLSWKVRQKTALAWKSLGKPMFNTSMAPTVWLDPQPEKRNLWQRYWNPTNWKKGFSSCSYDGSWPEYRQKEPNLELVKDQLKEDIHLKVLMRDHGAKRTIKFSIPKDEILKMPGTYPSVEIEREGCENETHILTEDPEDPSLRSTTFDIETHPWKDERIPEHFTVDFISQGSNNYTPLHHRYFVTTFPWINWFSANMTPRQALKTKHDFQMEYGWYQGGDIHGFEIHRYGQGIESLDWTVPTEKSIQIPFQDLEDLADPDKVIATLDFVRQRNLRSHKMYLELVEKFHFTGENFWSFSPSPLDARE